MLTTPAAMLNQIPWLSQEILNFLHNVQNFLTMKMATRIHTWWLSTHWMMNTFFNQSLFFSNLTKLQCLVSPLIRIKSICFMQNIIVKKTSYQLSEFCLITTSDDNISIMLTADVILCTVYCIIRLTDV